MDNATTYAVIGLLIKLVYDIVRELTRHRNGHDQITRREIEELRKEIDRLREWRHEVEGSVIWRENVIRKLLRKEEE